SRLELHNELLELLTRIEKTFLSEFQPADHVIGPKLYYQPPSNGKMSYPCVVYHKTPKHKMFGNNGSYLSKQGYQLTVIDYDPDSMIADEMESHFQHCSINQYLTVDNLN